MSNTVAQQTLGFGDAAMDADCLRRWPPDLHDLEEGWAPLVRGFLASSAGKSLSVRLTDALKTGKTVYPTEPFRALTLTPLSQVRVVILGQDPYHGQSQAEGLAFSVAPGGATAAKFAQHLQRVATKPSIACAAPRFFGALGQAGRAFTEYLPDGRGGTAGQSCALGLGGADR